MIRGSLVTLRLAREHDRRAIYQWLAESDLTSSMLGPPDFPETPVPTWEKFGEDYGPHFFDETRKELGRSFIIEVDGKAVGHVSYDAIDLTCGHAEIDIWLRSREVCGHGYGSDALVALTRYLYETFGIAEFIMRPSRRNPRAIRVYAKAGFTMLPLTSDEQTRIYGPGDYSDTVVMHKKLPA
ncbi:MAG: GNAT family N-acetyltransferase [Planctomycetaceae bacterium]|nr:GNAT family N-acetyltransferase [Planctomycetaceae bacterium]